MIIANIIISSCGESAGAEAGWLDVARDSPNIITC